MQNGVWTSVVKDEISELKANLKLKEINRLQKKLDDLQDEINEISKEI